LRKVFLPQRGKGRKAPQAKNLCALCGKIFLLRNKN